MQQPFVFLPRGQVSDEANKLPLCVGRNFANRQLHWKRAAIIPLTDDHAPNTDDTLLPRRDVSRQVAIMLLPIRFWHQQAHVLSRYLGFSVTKEPFRHRAKILDEALAVDHHHRVRHSGENGLQMSLFVSERLPDSLSGHR